MQFIAKLCSVQMEEPKKWMYAKDTIQECAG